MTIWVSGLDDMSFKVDFKGSDITVGDITLTIRAETGSDIGLSMSLGYARGLLKELAGTIALADAENQIRHKK